ncbi:hypothetical protein [uncultured Tateyamaria sp.]|uniref:hypothetical protein n=1 Tax=uncultured Tateyamaria sp. TaxID=455651 RepID=UPI00262D8EC4|nr:hypothetical protein [uncultured Tateyamaria sp.]
MTALEQALCDAHQQSLTKAGVIGLVVTAATHQLFQAGRYPEVAALVDASGLSLPALDHVRSEAERLLQGDRAGVTSASLQKDFEDGKIDARALVALKFRNRLRLRIDDYKLFWDKVPASLDEALEALNPENAADLYDARMIDTLLSLRPGAKEDRDAFTKRLLWGHAAADFFTFLRRYTMMLHSNAVTPKDFSDDDRAILQLNRQMSDLVIPPDDTKIAADITAGKTITLLGAHTGMYLLAEPRHFNTSLPRADVNQMTSSNLTSPDHMHVGTASKNFNMEFVSFIKKVQKRQTMIRIFPDGSNGQGKAVVDVLGKEVSLGLGAALIAWKTSSACHYIGTRWHGRKVQIDLVKGPDAATFDRREAFDAAFHKFYADCLIRVIRGAPEDMVARGLFWEEIYAGGAQISV